MRPDHLFLGTIQDNSDDMVSKGRGRGNPNPPQGDDHRLRRHPELVLRGERNPCAKLTMKQAAEILRRYQPRGRDSGARLAREFGVSPSAVSLIIRGKHWREVGNARA